MHIKSIYKIVMPALLLPAVVMICSCNDQDKKTPDAIKDTVAAANGTKSTTDSAKIVDSLKTTTPATTKEEKKDNPKLVSTSTDKTKTKTAPAPDKKKSIAKDSTAVAKKAEVPAENKSNAPATDNAKASTPDNSKTDKPFVSKYGIIPRNATENNITSFLNAFPDKHTIIKVNFDDDPDAEMQTVKAQIIKVLKKTGYTNINEQSLTLHPMRIPKEIHYELQHDGTVVIWVAPANPQQ